MSWIVDGTLVPEAVSGRAIINEEDVETQPEKVPASILNENVFLNSCRKYFTDDAWAYVEQLIICLQKNPVYYCGHCTNPIDDSTENSVKCSSCLIWFHYKCVTKVTKAKHWFCTSCYL